MRRAWEAFGCVQLMWVLADDCGLVANNVGQVADNLGPWSG